MRRNFTNERDYLNTVEQDRCAPPCCLNPPRPKPPLKPDTGFDCTCRTENCKVKFSTDPFSDCIEIKCRKRPEDSGRFKLSSAETAKKNRRFFLSEFFD